MVRHQRHNPIKTNQPKPTTKNVQNQLNRYQPIFGSLFIRYYSAKQERNSFAPNYIQYGVFLLTYKLNILVNVKMNANKIKTPCIGICSTVFGDSVCRGCQRYAQEVIHWNQFSEQEKQIVWQRLEKLQKQVIKEKIIIKDPGLLEAQLNRLKVRYNPQLDPYCWILSLFQQSKEPIDNLRDFGLETMNRFTELSVMQIHHKIQHELHELSIAHFNLSLERHLSRITAP